MSQTKLPEGWEDDKVRRVIAHYDAQTGGEALAEDEAGVRPSETVMDVPYDRVSTVRELTAKHHD